MCVDALDLSLNIADFCCNSIEVDFLFRLKGINIARDIQVEAVLFNLLHCCNVSVFINILTALVGLNNLVNVALPKDVLVLSSFKVTGSVDEKDVVRVTVALSLEDKNADRDARTKEQICRQTDYRVQNI